MNDVVGTTPSTAGIYCSSRCEKNKYMVYFGPSRPKIPDYVRANWAAIGRMIQGEADSFIVGGKPMGGPGGSGKGTLRSPSNPVYGLQGTKASQKIFET